MDRLVFALLLCISIQGMVDSEIRITEKPSKSSKETNSPLAIKQNQTLVLETINDLCRFFKVPSNNCSCSIFTFEKGDDSLADRLCKHNGKILAATTMIPTQKTKAVTKIAILAPIDSRYMPHANTPTPAPFVFKSIDDLCRLFSVPAQNCSCSLFTVEGSDGFDPMVESLCKHVPNNGTFAPQRILIYDKSLSRPYAAVSVISSIIGILGNAAVIVVAYNKGKRISRSRILITELAVTDLVFAILQLVTVIPVFWTNKWLYPPFTCKILKSAQVLGSLFSIGFILLIAFERFYAVINTFQNKKLSHSFLHTLSAANVLLGLVSIVPLIVVLDVNDLGRCGENWPNAGGDSLKFNIYLLFFYFLAPVLTICLLYWRVTAFLWQHIKKNVALKNNNEILLQKRMVENRRLTYIIIAILVAFIVCVLPNRVVWIYMDLAIDRMSTNVYMILSFIALIPYPLHVAVNPIIYSIIDRRWRRDIWLALTCTTTLQGVRLTETSQSVMRSMSSVKSYGARFGVDDKGRNASVDMGTHLLSYQPSSPASLKGNDDVFKA